MISNVRLEISVILSQHKLFSGFKDGKTATFAERFNGKLTNFEKIKLRRII